MRSQVQVVRRQEWEPGKLEHKPAGAPALFPMAQLSGLPMAGHIGDTSLGGEQRAVGPAMAIEPSRTLLSLIQNWKLCG